MEIGSDTVPNIWSAHAILMTRNKLLLRSLLFTANRTMVSKFPTTIKIDVKINAVHNAMLSALEGTILDESVAFSEVHVVLAAAVVFIFGLCLND